jgi:hypothetical protein
MTQSDTPLADLKPVNVAGSPPAREKSPDAVPKPKNAAPATATNIRYKIVKVGKADGTIVTVKRPIKQESMSIEHYALLSLLTNALALTTSSSSTSKVTTTTTTTNKLPAPAQQTSASVAQKSEKKVLATGLPAKSPDPVATPAKIESESSAKTAEQSTSASHRRSSVTPTDHESNILAGTSKVSKGISRLQHGPFKLATKLLHELDGDSDTNCGDDHSNSSGSDSEESGQETDSEADDKRGDTKPIDTGKTATNKAVRYRAPEDPIISEKKLKNGDVERDASLTTTLDEEEAKPLKEGYKHWSRYFIWGIMIIFPTLFIGM